MDPGRQLMQRGRVSGAQRKSLMRWVKAMQPEEVDLVRGSFERLSLHWAIWSTYCNYYIHIYIYIYIHTFILYYYYSKSLKRAIRERSGRFSDPPWQAVAPIWSRRPDIGKYYNSIQSLLQSFSLPFYHGPHSLSFRSHLESVNPPSYL